MIRLESGLRRASLAVAAILVIGGLACNAQRDSTDTASGTDREPARQMQGHMGDVETMPRGAGGMMSMGDMMSHMQGMHGRFQQMSQEQHWMHDEEMMPGAEQMMSMSDHMTTMTEAMQEAMSDMQALRERSGEGGGPQADHLQQMQRHMQAMGEQLDAMSEVMSQTPTAGGG